MIFSRSTICMVLLLVGLTAPAVARTSKVFFGKHDQCSPNQSCLYLEENVSLIAAEGTKMSVPLPTSPGKSTDCADGFFNRGIDETIHICEAFLKSGAGAVRDRASVMFVLGHAYTRTPEAFRNYTYASESKSIKVWNEAVALDPTYIDPLLSIGRMYSMHGQLSKAQEVFDRAEEKNPKDWRVYTGRVDMFEQAQIIPGMIEAADKAMEINPRISEVRVAHARALFLSNRFEEAAEEYKIAIQGYNVDEHNSLEMVVGENPLISLADTYRIMGKPLLAAGAMTSYIEGLKPGARNFHVYQQRAEFFELAGLYGKAADDLKTAASTAPEHFIESFHAKRAMLLAQSGNKTEAGEDLHSILESGSLKPILKVQLFLRNQGYSDVKINGRYDAVTRHALDTCLQDKACAPGVGRAI